MPPNEGIGKVSRVQQCLAFFINAMSTSDESSMRGRRGGIDKLGTASLTSPPGSASNHPSPDASLWELYLAEVAISDRSHAVSASG